MELIFGKYELVDIIFNILCSLTASFIFIFLLLFSLKPKVKIVKSIAEKQLFLGDESQVYFMFKIINKSWFSAYEIKAELSSYRIIQGENDIIDKHYTHLELRNANVSYIPGRTFFGKENGENCVVFVTKENIRKLLKEPNINIQFLITAKHGLSGLNHVVKYYFTLEKSVELGKFVSGDCEDII